MPNTCTERVADYTDSLDCGKPVLRANRCEEHLHDEVQSLCATIKEHEAAIAKCHKRLAQLNTESG